MAYFKAISGHSGTGGIRRYLEKNGRALAVDLLNLGDPERCEDWSAVMDQTRRLAGNDAAYRGGKCRTFKHYVLSPDPKDRIDLGTLRLLATKWAEENYPDFEVAIVYHDDNRGHVPHAHVVVNNTNLQTGRRLRENDPGALNGSLQTIARDLGLSHFEGRLDGGPRAEAGRHKSVLSRTEYEAGARGSYSWVTDIRARVAIARDTSTSEREFLKALEGLGVEVTPASAKTGGSWVYGFPDRTSCHVSGTRLGPAFTRQGILERLGGVPNAVSLNARDAARSAIEIGDVNELNRVAGAVDLIYRRGFRCVAGIQTAIERSRERGSADLAELEQVRDCCREKGLLPEHVPKSTSDRRSKAHPTKRRTGHVQGAKTSGGGSTRSDRPLEGWNRDERSRR